MTDILPKETINSTFLRQFQQQHLNPTWGADDETLGQFDFTRQAGFTFTYIGGATHLIGLHFAAGNAERTFLGMADLGVAPASLVTRPESGLDFSRFVKIDPKVREVFSSPDRATIFVLTADRMIAIDTKTKRELYNFEHGIRFNKIIMAEWAVGDNHTRDWGVELTGVGLQLPSGLSCQQ